MRGELLGAGQVDCYDATNPMLKWDTARLALCDAAGLPGLRFHDLRHNAITGLAEMSVADHVLESISGHLSRRMLEHYSHIRIDAKRGALDALVLPGARPPVMAMGTARTGLRSRRSLRSATTFTSQSRQSWFCADLRPPGNC